MINDILLSAPILRDLKYSLSADHCAIWHSSTTVQFSAGRDQAAPDSVQRWALQQGFEFPSAKSVMVVFTHKAKILTLQLNLDNNQIPLRITVKFLGLHFDRRLNWK